jgi:hypothetical protein
VLGEMRPYHGLVVETPLIGSKRCQIGYEDIVIEERLLVHESGTRLYLDQRIIRPEVNRPVGLSKAQVGNERAEPLVGFDNALKGFILTAMRHISRRAH